MSCPAILSGALWNLGNSLFAKEFNAQRLTAEEWRVDLDDLCRIGMKKLLLFTGIPRAMETPAKAADDLLDFIFRECFERGMEVIIAAGGNEHWYPDLKVPEETRRVQRYVDTLYRNYGSYPSFAGWYIDYEFCLIRGELGRRLRELYKAVVEICKGKTPALPVVASPFFEPPTEGNIMNMGSHSVNDYYEYWSDVISYSHFDVLSLQDNGGQHFSYFTARDTEPYIAAYAKACRENHCRFWGNVETGELEVASAQDFIQRFGQDGNCNTDVCAPFWRPVPIERLKAKLSLMSQYSECNFSWGCQAFYRPRLGEKSARAYLDYQNYYRSFQKAPSHAGVGDGV